MVAKNIECFLKYQMASPENIHTDIIIQTEQVTFRNICLGVYKTKK